MRIAIVAHNVVRMGDGQGRANYEFVHYLANNGHEVHLYANRVEPDSREKIVFHPIPAIQRPFILKAPMFLISASLKLFYRKYDCIYVDSGTYLGYYDFMGCHWCHTRFLRYEVGFYHRIYAIFNSWIERLEYKRKGTIIAVSGCLKHELIEEFHIPEERIKVVYNGVEPLESQKSKVKSQKSKGLLTLLFVGDLSYRKGLDFLFEAMRGVVSTTGIDKNITLLVAGKPRKRYKKLAKGLNVEFLGFRLDIPELLKRVDGFILPSLYEPFGIVVLEALAEGLPVLVSARAGVSELVRDMENGIIIKDPTNINELREKIEFLASNPELRKRLGANALATAQNYSWVKMAKEKALIVESA